MRINHYFSHVSNTGLWRARGVFFVFASAVVFGLSVSTGPDGTNAKAVHALGYSGQGVNVGLISLDHARITHEAFDGHAHWYNATDQNSYVPSNHDTSVGGIICSRGSSLYPDDKGVAPGAELYSVKITNDGSISTAWIANALGYLLDQQARVVVTGIQFAGTSVNPDGTSFWSLIYDYYAYEHNMIFATAAGNYDSTITTFGDSYNSITTGGLIASESLLYGKVGYGSNYGPTADGRRKPEITAPSQNQWVPVNGDTSWKNEGSTAGQTSWAVPHAGGTAALLLNYADDLGNADAGQNVVIKAVVTNSTFPNIQNEYGTATTQQVWNNYRGYGRLDALRALELLAAPQMSPSSSTSVSKGWAFESLTGGDQHTYIIEGIENERLVMTLAWNRRVQWKDIISDDVIQPGELVPSLADLDLEIRNPDGSILVENISDIDNLDKVDLLLTQSGSYNISVINHSATESTAYGLAFEIIPPLPGDIVIDYVVNDLDLSMMANYWMQTIDSIPTASSGIDLVGNGVIDMADFAFLTQHWMNIDNRYYNSN